VRNEKEYIMLEAAKKKTAKKRAKKKR